MTASKASASSDGLSAAARHLLAPPEQERLAEAERSAATGESASESTTAALMRARSPSGSAGKLE